MNSKRYVIGSITITQHAVAWNDLGDWNDLADIVTERLGSVEPDGRYYLNAEFTLSASESVPLDEFVKEARRSQMLWNKHLRQVHGPGPRKRLIKRLDPLNRPLVTTGVMVLAGRPIHPKGWPDRRVVRSTAGR